MLRYLRGVKYNHGSSLPPELNLAIVLYILVSWGLWKVCLTLSIFMFLMLGKFNIACYGKPEAEVHLLLDLLYNSLGPRPGWVPKITVNHSSLCSTLLSKNLTNHGTY